MMRVSYIVVILILHLTAVSCHFPGSAVISTNEGEITMSELAKGVKGGPEETSLELVGIRTSLGYERLSNWLHYDPDSVSEFITIELEDGQTVTGSPDQLIYYHDECPDFVFASMTKQFCDNNRGSMYHTSLRSFSSIREIVLPLRKHFDRTDIQLLGIDGKFHFIKDVATVTEKGSYSPYLNRHESDTIYVDGFLCSTYFEVDEWSFWFLNEYAAHLFHRYIRQPFDNSCGPVHCAVNKTLDTIFMFTGTIIVLSIASIMVIPFIVFPVVLLYLCRYRI